jgi:hypothetical protein
MIPPSLLIPTKIPVSIPPAEVKLCARWCETYAGEKPRCLEQCYLRYLHSVMATVEKIEKIKST